MTSDWMKNKGYFAMFGDCYKVMSGFNPSSPDWGKLVKDADDVGEKWKKSPQADFCFDLINLIIKECEKICSES